MRVDPSNAAQLRYWDGEDGEYWVKRSLRFDLGVHGYRESLRDAAAITRTDVVLDIGCGSGQTACDAAECGAASVLGVDLSAAMIESARGRAAHKRLTNVVFEQADAQVHPFADAHFDIAVSRHGAMFFGDPHAAFGNIARALRPGGRMVLLSWQPLKENEWLMAIRAAMSRGRKLPAPRASPGSLQDPDQVRALLTGAGFTDVRVTALARPMYFGHNADDAFRFLAGQHASTLAGLVPRRKARVLRALQASMIRHETPGGVYLGSAAWLIEARRG